MAVLDCFPRSRSRALGGNSDGVITTFNREKFVSVGFPEYVARDGSKRGGHYQLHVVLVSPLIEVSS